MSTTWKIALFALGMAACSTGATVVDRDTSPDMDPLAVADMARAGTTDAAQSADDMAHASTPDMVQPADLSPGCGGEGQPCCDNFTCNGSGSVACMSDNPNATNGTCWPTTQNNQSCGSYDTPACSHPGSVGGTDMIAPELWCARLPQSVGTGWWEGSPCKN